MKFLFLCPVATNGGVETHVSNILKSLKNDQVIIATRFYNSETNLAKFCIQNSIIIEKIDLPKIKVLSSLIYGLKLIKILLKYHINKIYSIEINYILLFVAKFYKIKILFNFAGDPKDISLFTKKFNKLLSNNVVIIESETHKIEILQNINTIVLPHISNIEKYNAIVKTKSYNIRLGFLSWITPHKGAIEVFILFIKILNKIPNCNLIYFGDGPSFEYLLNMTNELNLKEKVTFANKWSSIESLQEIHKNIDICIMLSISEGLPLTLIECCAYRTPFISTQVGAISELLEYSPNSLILNQDVENWENQIINYLSSNVWRKKTFIDQEKFNNKYGSKILQLKYLLHLKDL